MVSVYVNAASMIVQLLIVYVWISRAQAHDEFERLRQQKVSVLHEMMEYITYRSRHKKNLLTMCWPHVVHMLSERRARHTFKIYFACVVLVELRQHIIKKQKTKKPSMETTTNVMKLFRRIEHFMIDI
jgi:hypothetical protein